MKYNFYVEEKGVKVSPILHPNDLRQLSEQEIFCIVIKKWRVLVDHLRQAPNTFISTGGIHTCAFCILYHLKACAGCPIYETTKVEYCEATPFYRYENYTWPENQLFSPYYYANRELNFLLEIRHEYFGPTNSSLTFS